MHYIANAFSLQMLTAGSHKMAISDCDISEVVEVLVKRFPLGEVQFAVGHADTANVVANQLNAEMSQRPDGWMELSGEQVFVRRSISLQEGDVLYVLQVVGGRLPEGSTELPEGVSMIWKRVSFCD